MHCWICGIDITEANSSGSKKSGRLKNECIACHSIYNLFTKLSKESDSELISRIEKYEKLISIYNNVLNDKAVRMGKITERKLVSRIKNFDNMRLEEKITDYRSLIKMHFMVLENRGEAKELSKQFVEEM